MRNTPTNWISADDCQLLLYDLSEPLPTNTGSSTRTGSRPTTTKTNYPDPYSLSPAPTPQSRNTPSPALAVEMAPVRAWTAESEVNNLSFDDSGDWIGCVSGSKLSVLQVGL